MRNFARGGQKYQQHRVEIARILLRHRSRTLGNFGAFLSNRFLSLEAGWSAFSFVPRDWELLDQLRDVQDAQVEENYLALVLAYVSSNLESVKDLYNFNRTLSERLLLRDAPDIAPGSDDLSAIDSQSLFNFRVQCAQSNSAGESIRDRLQSLLSNPWCRGRLIYPLVYHFAEPAQSLDVFLDYVVAGDNRKSERAVLKLLLSDEAAKAESLPFKAYVGLLGHPYDACEFILDHIEFNVVEQLTPAPHLTEFLRTLATLLPGTRSERLHEVSVGQIAVGEPEASAFDKAFSIPGEDRSHYFSLVSLEPFQEKIEERGRRPFQILGQMRTEPYPVPAEFTWLSGDATNWFFTDAGRLITAMMRSIYMVNRISPDIERRDVHRLIQFFGAITPLMATAPSAVSLLRHFERSGRFSSTDLQATMDEAERALTEAEALSDRLWINRLQWKLRKLEEGGRILAWLACVREEAKLRPTFLTGINWEWVDQVVTAERLRPFQSWEGAYLFLLMENEVSGIDPLLFRTTVAMLTRDMSFEQVLKKLIEEFDDVAPAIARRYLTTQNLLARGLATNYMSALDQRVRALEACIKKFEFNEFLDEEVYESEKRTLTSELLLTHVNTGKFEVPWDIFRADSLENHQALFRAFATLQPRRHDRSDEAETVRLMATIENVFAFPNSRNDTFKYPAYRAPLFSLLMALISDFMEHPAFGLEVILSGRFRHSNLLQELWSALSSIEAAAIKGVSNRTKRDILELYRDSMEVAVEEWCATFLHTKRREKPAGLFDLIPPQRDLDSLFDQTEELSDLSDIVDHVIEWLKEKLRKQVDDARKFFVADFSAALSRNFEATRTMLEESGQFSAAELALVHAAVEQATVYRIEELKSWFDGIDTTVDGPISLDELITATSTLFDNVLPGKRLDMHTNDAAGEIRFEPKEVKIAFDLVREVLFNALKGGKGPDVKVRVWPQESEGAGIFTFSNLANVEDESPEPVEVRGARYETPSDALFREGNSGLSKVASSAATLVKNDVILRPQRRTRSYHIAIPLRCEP